MHGYVLVREWMVKSRALTSERSLRRNLHEAALVIRQIRTRHATYKHGGTHVWANGVTYIGRGRKSPHYQKHRHQANAGYSRTHFEKRQNPSEKRKKEKNTISKTCTTKANAYSHLSRVQFSPFCPNQYALHGSLAHVVFKQPGFQTASKAQTVVYARNIN